MLRRLTIALCTLMAFPTLAGSIFLAGQRVEFDSQFVPRFSDRQVRGTDPATRAGLARFAATEHGHKLLAYFTAGEYEIDVREDLTEREAGTATEPGLLTLLAANDSRVLKKYSISLNPSTFGVPAGATPLAGQPATAAEGMSAAWAAELLHVYFYSRGLRLPHHSREQFQREWQLMAAELGFPALQHGSEDGQ